MNEDEVYRRFEELFAEIHGEEIKARARKSGGLKSWTRQRDMPLHDMLTRMLARKGLGAAMEARHYFQAAGKAEQTSLS